MDLSRFAEVSSVRFVDCLVPVSQDTYKTMRKKLKFSGVIEKDVFFKTGNNLYVFVDISSENLQKHKLRVYYALLIHKEDCYCNLKSDFEFLFFSKSEVELFKETLKKVDHGCSLDIFKGWICKPPSS